MPLGKRRPLFTFDLDWPVTQGVLRRKGFRKAGEVKEEIEAGRFTAAELSMRDYNPTDEEIAHIQQVLTTSSPDDTGTDTDTHTHTHTPLTSLEMYQAQKQAGGSRRIITFCKAIDTMLGGGVQRGQVTEIYGVPGTGKTQIAMQLAIDVQIPQSFRGSGGQAVYIDTEGSFMAGRAAEMGEALIDHLQRIVSAAAAKYTHPQTPTHTHTLQAGEVERLTLECVLGNVFVFRCLDDAELLQTLQHLPMFLEGHPQVALVVIDSIAFPFRQDKVFQTETAVSKARIVNIMARELNTLAQEENVAVVVTNQMTTKVDDTSSSNALTHTHTHTHTSALAPTLGESWAPAAAVRVSLWTSATGQRCASLIKHPGEGQKTVFFRVCSLGIRDTASSSSSTRAHTHTHTHTVPQPQPPQPPQPPAAAASSSSSAQAHKHTHTHTVPPSQQQQPQQQEGGRPSFPPYKPN